MKPEQMRKKYKKYAKKFFGRPLDFPYKINEIGQDESSYVRVAKNGNFLLLFSERGKERIIEEAHSFDELMYHIFSSYAYADAFRYEAENRILERDSRRITYPFALKKMSKVSGRWKKRMAKEQELMLRENPLDDKID